MPETITTSKIRIHELPGNGINVLFVKTGLSMGGASCADIDLINIFRGLGANVNLFTGYLSPQMEKRLRSESIPYQVDKALDRDLHKPSKKIFESIMRQSDQHNLFLFSQPFSGDAPEFSEAVTLCSQQEIPSYLRSYDPIRSQSAFSKLSPTVLGLPATQIIADQMTSVNRRMKIVILPVGIEAHRFDQQVNTKEIRRALNIEPKDFVIFQPTRIDPNKRIDRAIQLAVIMQKELKNDGRKVFLLIAGGNEPTQRSIAEKQHLVNLSNELNFSNLIFLNGPSPEQFIGYMKSSNLVTFMSEIEGFGMPPVESCMAEIPCLTTRYVNPDGKPIFNTVYGNKFQFIIEPDLYGTSVNTRTIETIKRLARNPADWNNIIANNKMSSQIYSTETVRRLVKSLLEALS